MRYSYRISAIRALNEKKPHPTVRTGLPVQASSRHFLNEAREINLALFGIGIKKVDATVIYVFVHFRDALGGLLGEPVLFEHINPAFLRHRNGGDYTAERFRECRGNVLG